MSRRSDSSESLDSLEPAPRLFKPKSVTYRKKKELMERQQKFEQMRKRFTIPTSSLLYQIWKVLGIILCFVSSF